ncbi:hypothetical protein IAT40_001183 [Kwoniella sp. CBS 6097]
MYNAIEADAIEANTREISLRAQSDHSHGLLGQAGTSTGVDPVTLQSGLSAGPDRASLATGTPSMHPPNHAEVHSRGADETAVDYLTRDPSATVGTEAPCSYVQGAHFVPAHSHPTRGLDSWSKRPSAWDRLTRGPVPSEIQVNTAYPMNPGGLHPAMLRRAEADPNKTTPSALEQGFHALQNGRDVVGFHHPGSDGRSPLNTPSESQFAVFGDPNMNTEASEQRSGRPSVPPNSIGQPVTFDGRYGGQEILVYHPHGYSEEGQLTQDCRLFFLPRDVPEYFSSRDHQVDIEYDRKSQSHRYVCTDGKYHTRSTKPAIEVQYQGPQPR